MCRQKWKSSTACTDEYGRLLKKLKQHQQCLPLEQVAASTAATGVRVAWNKINVPIEPSWAISKIVSSLLQFNGGRLPLESASLGFHWGFTADDDDDGGYSSRPSHACTAAPSLVSGTTIVWLLYATCDLISFQLRFKRVFTRERKRCSSSGAKKNRREGRDAHFWRWWQFAFCCSSAPFNWQLAQIDNLWCLHCRWVEERPKGEATQCAQRLSLSRRKLIAICRTHRSTEVAAGSEPLQQWFSRCSKMRALSPAHYRKWWTWRWVQWAGWRRHVPCANVSAAKCRHRANQHRRDALAWKCTAPVQCHQCSGQEYSHQESPENEARQGRVCSRRRGVKDNSTVIDGTTTTEDTAPWLTEPSFSLHLINLMTLH